MREHNPNPNSHRQHMMPIYTVYIGMFDCKGLLLIMLLNSVTAVIPSGLHVSTCCLLFGLSTPKYMLHGQDQGSVSRRWHKNMCCKHVWWRGREGGCIQLAGVSGKGPSEHFLLFKPSMQPHTVHAQWDWCATIESNLKFHHGKKKIYILKRKERSFDFWAFYCPPAG